MAPPRIVFLAGVLGLLTGLDTPRRHPPAPRRAGATPHTRQVPEARLIDSLLAAMTFEEKLGQLTLGAGVSDPAATADLALVRQGRVGGFLSVFGAGATRTAQRVAVEQSRLGIPLLLGYDVIHGFRTIFPIPLAEASTWDPGAAAATARAAAREAAAAGVNWTFAPMVDIARDPRWGRIAEGSAEDPYLRPLFPPPPLPPFQRHPPSGPVLPT